MYEKSKVYLDEFSKYVIMQPFPFVVDLKNSHGMWIHTVDDDELFDWCGYYGSKFIGHNHPKMFEPAYVEKLVYAANNKMANPDFLTPECVEYYRKLYELAPKCMVNPDLEIYAVNSGAEANENALKVASFHTNKSRVIAFDNSFHGRTSAAVAVTDNKKIVAPLNAQQVVTFLPLNQIDLVEAELKKGDVCAVIIEPIQGVGGLDQGTTEFFQALEKVCKANEVILILDEVQSGYGRSGKFFAHQHHGINPDIVTTAKGMGNGFPIGGVLISPKFKASYGLLGTTFGGSHLACAAGIAVLDVMESKNLMENTNKVSEYFFEAIKVIPEIIKVKGRGLMLGVEFDFDVSALRKKMIIEKHIFTGGANNKNLLRILPPLTITTDAIDTFIVALQESLAELKS